MFQFNFLQTNGVAGDYIIVLPANSVIEVICGMQHLLCQESGIYDRQSSSIVAGALLSSPLFIVSFLTNLSPVSLAV